VVADIKGNLAIESLQDTATLDGKRQSASVSGTVGAGAGFSASFSQSKVHNDFASVQEQSGIRAGDGGFQLQVAGNTDLKGGVISSSEQAIKDGRNSLATASLSFSDIQNRDSHDASGVSLGVNVGKNQTGDTFSPSLAPGIGQVTGSQASVTRSGVSGAALTLSGEQAGQAVASLNRDVSTGKDTSQALTKSWTGAQGLNEVGAQMQITSAAMPRLAKEIGDYAENKVAELKAQGNQEEAAKWAEGGIYRVAAHAALGAMGGGLEGAVGAGASAATAPVIAKVINDVGLPEPVRQLAIAAAGAAVGAVAGSTTGALTGVNQTVNNFLKHEQAAAMKADLSKCQAKPGGCTDEDTRALIDKYLRLSNQNISIVDACIKAGNVQCVQTQFGQAASIREVSGMLPFGWGKFEDVFVARQDNVNAYGSVRGKYSLFGNDVQQAQAIAKFRSDNCVALSTSACNGLVDQALNDRLMRAGLLSAIGAAVPLAVNGVRSYVPSKVASRSNITTVPEAGIGSRAIIGDEPYSPSGLSDGGMNHPVAAKGNAVASGSGSVSATNPKNYGVTFFGDDILPFYDPSKATIGKSNGAPTFFMPLEDASLVSNAHDAAVYTGMAPSAQKAYLSNKEIFGFSFPTDGLKVAKPTSVDAGGWPHFLEGGQTAVKLEGPNAGYMVTPVREFVTPGSSPVPRGSVLFEVGPNGEWIPLRRW
jgi:filamentous hemagglutinin